MDAREIDIYLAELGQELGRLGIQTPLRILMVGGAYMLTQIGSRTATKDIDMVLADIPDPSLSPLYPIFRAAVRAVAAHHQLPMSWMNDVIGDALRNYGPLPQGQFWCSYGPLEVYIPDAAYILALKILAGRPQDILDARAICQRDGITTRAAPRRAAPHRRYL